MKKKITLISISCFLLLTVGLNAQKLKVTSGDLSYLKDSKTLLVKYEYNNMTVGKMTEEEYLNKKSTELNQKEAGRGDKWKTMWVEDRKKRFEPKFEELFNKVLSEKGVSASQNSTNAKYIITIKTTWTEPGFYVGVSSKPALITGKIFLASASDPSKNLAEIDFINSPGNSVGATWDTGERIKESYAKLGKSLAAFFIKNKVF